MIRTAPSRRRPWPPRRTAARLAAGAALATTVALAAAGCSAGGPAEGDGSTLVIQSGIAGYPTLEASYDDIVAAFQEAHPEIDVQYTVLSFDELTNTGRLQLTGDNPPMLTQANQGYEALGAFATAGLLTPLTDYAEEGGWTDRISPEFLDQNGAFTEDGRMGEGTLWGLSTSNFGIPLWMNDTVAASLGITAPPATLEEFEQQMQIALDAGVVPFQFGTSDGAQPAWLLTQLMTAFGGPDAVNAVVYHEEGARLDDEVTLEAATTIQDWAEKGYFSPDWASYSNDDVLGRFLQGEGLFTLNGTWQVPLANGDDGTFSVMALPSDSGAQPAAVLTGDLPWVIPANAPNKELAVEFLDYVVSEEGQRIFLENGALPAATVPDADAVLQANAAFGPTMDETVAVNTELLETGGAVPYLDWSGVGLLDTIHSGLDELTAGRITPEQFTAQLQATYEQTVSGSGS